MFISKQLQYLNYFVTTIFLFQVAGRVLSRNYDQIGKDIKTGVDIHSDVYNPIYEEKVEYRQPKIHPTATLLLKVIKEIMTCMI